MDLVCGVGISGPESSSLIPVSHSFTRTYTKNYLKKPELIMIRSNIAKP